MKITEAWINRDKIISKCKEASACKPEFHKLISAEAEKEFKQILINNYNWCLIHNIIELSDCEDFNNLTSLNLSDTKNITIPGTLIKLTSLNLIGAENITIPENIKKLLNN